MPSPGLDDIGGYVKVLDSVFRVCIAHALLTEREEVLGLLFGNTSGKEVYIWNSITLRRSDKRADRCEISPEQLTEAISAAERLTKDTGKATRVIGWYHSHPHITRLPSHVDLQTQLQYQAMEPSFVGLIFAVFNAQPGAGKMRHEVMGFRSGAPGAEGPRRVNLQVDVVPLDSLGFTPGEASRAMASASFGGALGQRGVAATTQEGLAEVLDTNREQAERLADDPMGRIAARARHTQQVVEFHNNEIVPLETYFECQARNYQILADLYKQRNDWMETRPAEWSLPGPPRRQAAAEASPGRLLNGRGGAAGAASEEPVVPAPPTEPSRPPAGQRRPRSPAPALTPAAEGLAEAVPPNSSQSSESDEFVQLDDSQATQLAPPSELPDHQPRAKQPRFMGQGGRPEDSRQHRPADPRQRSPLRRPEAPEVGILLSEVTREHRTGGTSAGDWATSAPAVPSAPPVAAPSAASGAAGGGGGARTALPGASSSGPAVAARAPQATWDMTKCMARVLKKENDWNFGWVSYFKQCGRTAKRANHRELCSIHLGRLDDPDGRTYGRMDEPEPPLPEAEGEQPPQHRSLADALAQPGRAAEPQSRGDHSLDCEHGTVTFDARRSGWVATRVDPREERLFTTADFGDEASMKAQMFLMEAVARGAEPAPAGPR